jgi:hypothetical protein
MDRLMITELCTCNTCMKHMTAKPSDDPFVNKFHDMVRTGTVRHVETINGKVLYRLHD